MAQSEHGKKITKLNDLCAESERLVLRNWRAGDRQSFQEHCNNAEVMRWLGAKPQTKKELNEDVDWFERKQCDFGCTFWVVERKADSEFLGFCGLVVLEADDDGIEADFVGELEIGWRFRQDVWGQGYAKEAAVAAMNFAFTELSASRVISRTEYGNKDSWGLMRRLGMRHDFSRDYGPSGDHRTVVYVMNWRDWQTARPS